MKTPLNKKNIFFVLCIVIFLQACSVVTPFVSASSHEHIIAGINNSIECCNKQKIGLKNDFKENK